jgi:two-component system chemotaxis response regulator CheB
MSKIRVLVVDNSALIRKLVSEILNADPDIEVIDTAEDPYVARDKIKALNPDVITLDIEMPKMDGLTFLRNIMRLRPMPVVMLSTLTAKGSEHTLEALSIGAIDFVLKPALSEQVDLDAISRELISKVKIAGKANMRASSGAAPAKPSGALNLNRASSKVSLITIGASTGGTEAIRAVLERLPDNMPPIVMAQHIPKEFSAPFAQRVNGICRMTVKEAEPGEVLRPGHAYLAPGSHHLTVRRGASGSMTCELDLREPVNRHRPSVDVLFDSVVDIAGRSSVGVLLTGMGKDGAQGLLRLKQAGAITIAQDQASSVVWGMPGEAVKIGGASEVIALDQIAEKLVELVSSDAVSTPGAGIQKPTNVARPSL